MHKQSKSTSKGYVKVPGKILKEEKKSKLSNDAGLTPIRLERTLRKDTDPVREIAQSVVKLMVSQENKEPVPLFKGSGHPVSLRPQYPGYVLVDTKESQLLKTTLAGMFRDKHYHFRLSTALNMSSSASGAVNSVIENTALQYVPDFISLSTVFNEFFISKVHVRWMPVSRYNYPLTGVPATNVANLPIGVASIQHTQAVYTSLATMTDNYHFGFHSTGDPFDYTWKNPEDINSGIVTGTPIQSWANVTDAPYYTGQIQLLSQSAPPGMPASQVLGTFAVFWDVHFRLRI